MVHEISQLASPIATNPYGPTSPTGMSSRMHSTTQTYGKYILPSQATPQTPIYFSMIEGKYHNKPSRADTTMNRFPADPIGVPQYIRSRVPSTNQSSNPI